MSTDLFGRPGSYPRASDEPAREPIEAVESDHPWLWPLYAVGVVAGILGSIFWPQPFGG